MDLYYPFIKEEKIFKVKNNTSIFSTYIYMYSKNTIIPNSYIL